MASEKTLLIEVLLDTLKISETKSTKCLFAFK